MKLLRIATLVLAVIILLDAVIVTFIANFSFGTVCAYILAILLSLFCAFITKLPMWIRISFPALVALGFICVGSLLIYGSFDNVSYTEDAVIVLGAGIRGDKPSRVLRYRLDRAAEYHRKNPDALIVVSGGKGSNETVTEAYAMEKYLISVGVDPSVIVKEERSTSTKENFMYSRMILDEMLGEDYNVAYITNSFHIFRAGRYAAMTGFKGVTHMHGTTPTVTMLPDGMRECLAIIKLWLID